MPTREIGLQKGPPAEEHPWGGPIEQEPDDDSSWEALVAAAPEGYFTDALFKPLLNAALSKVQTTTKSISIDLLVACRLLHLNKAMQKNESIAINTDIFLTEPFRRHMRRFSRAWPEAEAQIIALARARCQIMFEVRSAAARTPRDPRLQHQAAQELERSFYYQNVESIHKCYTIFNVYGALIYGIPY